MKTALLILAVAVILLVVTVFVRSRHSTHLDVTPDAREQIEKAKHGERLLSHGALFSAGG